MALLLVRDGYLFLTDGTEAATSFSSEVIERDFRNTEMMTIWHSVVLSISSWLDIKFQMDYMGFFPLRAPPTNVAIWTTDCGTTNLVEAKIPYPTGLARLLFRIENKLWALVGNQR